MFDQLKGLAGMTGLLKDLPRLKERFARAKERLGDVRVEGESGGGAVRAVADGQLRIVSLEIETAMLVGIVDPQAAEDSALAAELIRTAVNNALEKARAAAEQEMADAASEMGLPMPPGGLGGLMS